MTKHQRVAAILAELAAEETKTVAELAEHLDVSEATVRRDLKELEIQARITRSYGRARIFDPNRTRYSPEYSAEQRRLADRAAAFVQSGQVIILPSGLVNELIAPLLAEKTRITVITNSPAIFDIVKSHPTIQLISIGGIYSHTGNCLYGHLSETSLRELRADITFFDPSGVDVDGGFTHDNIVEVPTLKVITRTARSIILTVRSDVVEKASGAYVGGLDMVTAIVADRDGLPAPFLESLSGKDTELAFTGEAEQEPSE
jgi:DeoR family transcriptional regulator, fructose operon transcriptional repressor